MANVTPLTPLAAALLRELAADTRAEEAGMSLTRLGKRLGQGVSVLMRHLSLMGDATIGGVRGPGWVLVQQHDARWVARLTPAGRARADSLPSPTDAA